MKIDLIPLIIKKKKQIFLFVFSWVVIGFLYSIFATPLYNSYISIYPSENENSLSSMGNFGLMVSQFQNLGRGGSSNNLGGFNYHMKDLVESRDLKTKIINKKWQTKKNNNPISLIEYWELDQNNYDGFFDWIKMNFFDMLTDDVNQNRLDDANNILDNRIEIIEEDSGMFIINVLMEEASLSSAIANYIATEIDLTISEKSTEKANKNLEFIKDQKETAYDSLTASENRLKKFIKENPTMDTPEAQFQNLRKVRELEINQELYLTILKEYEISKIEAAKEVEIVHILDSATPSVERSQPNLIFILIVMFNFSFISITSFYFVYENYFKKH